MDNLRMLSMAPCVKNLKIPKNTICKLENKQRNERQKRKEWIIGVICRPIIFCVFVFLKRKRKYRVGLFGICLDMPTNRYLCICICEKKRGKKEEVCWGSVLICRPICQSHSPGAIARNTSAHQRIQIQRATFPLQIQLGMQT